MGWPFEDMTRRAFLARLGAVAAAPRLLATVPPKDYGIPDSALPEELDRVHRFVGSLMGWNEPVPTLLWAELPLNDGEKPRFMLWTPETEEEHAAAERFRRTISWQPWTTREELRAILATGDRWLVRNRSAGGRMLFIAASNETGVLGSGTAHLGMTGDPADAAVVGSARAEEIILELVAEGYSPTPMMSTEPVHPSRPWWDRRYQFLARPGMWSEGT